VTADSIVLGGTAPLTGPASFDAAVARGAEAYFRYVNAQGGVNGRSIVYTVRDDGYNPALTVPATRQLVEQDKVFAVFNSVGTAENLAVRPYLNSAGVPQLFLASGASAFGRDHAQYPYTTGFQPSYEAEGWVYGTYLARAAPGATVAVLFQNDDYGKELLDGLERGLQRSSARVLVAEPYDPGVRDISAQVAKLASSRADTLALFAAPAFALKAYGLAAKLGWKPRRVITNAVASSAPTMRRAAAGARRALVNGTLSATYLKDPTDPQWRNDPGMTLYRRLVAKYLPAAKADDALYVYGMAVAWAAVEALREAGRDLTRASLQKVLDTFTVSGNPFLVPGIVVTTSGPDHVPIDQLVLERFRNGAWRSFGGLWSYTAP